MGNLTEFNIDWNKIDTKDLNFSPLPAGAYAAKVIASELKTGKKDPKSKYFNFTFEVLGEKYKGRKIFAMFTTANKNPKAVKWGLAKLKLLAESIGVDFDNMGDTSELHGIPVGIKIKIKVDDEYGDKNEIISFKEFSEDLLEEGSEESESIEVDNVVDNVNEDLVVEDEVVEELLFE